MTDARVKAALNIAELASLAQRRATKMSPRPHAALPGRASVASHLAHQCPGAVDVRVMGDASGPAMQFIQPR